MGLIPCEVVAVFNCPIFSYHTMAPGSTQLALNSDSYTAICESNVYNRCGILDTLQSCGPPWHVIGIALHSSLVFSFSFLFVILFTFFTLFYFMLLVSFLSSHYLWFKFTFASIYSQVWPFSVARIHSVCTAPIHFLLPISYVQVWMFSGPHDFISVCSFILPFL
jgi:hypothetical protein